MAAPGMTGGCLCGAVRFELESPPRSAGYCHCTRCQRRTGAGASANSPVDGRGFRIVHGEEHVTGWRHPDGGAAKFFCRICGGHVFSRVPEHPEQVGIRLGAFDGDPGVRPAWRQYTEFAAPWEAIPDDGLERFPGPRDAGRA